jgi:branched-chain amino acid transport system ATP-binding protein
VLALSMSQDAIVLERGTVTYSGSSAALAADDDLLNQLLGVAMRAPA